MAARTYKQILRQLPMDSLLKSLLDKHEFIPSDAVEFTGAMSSSMTNMLIKEMEEYHDKKVLSKLAADLVHLSAFDSKYAYQAFCETLGNDEESKNIMAGLSGNLHRALWFLLNRKELLPQAKHYMEFDKSGTRSYRVRFNGAPVLNLSEGAKETFKSEIMAFYAREQGCGSHAKVDVTDRTEDIVHFYIYIEGIEDVIEEYKNDELKQTAIFPPLISSLQYDKRTGILECQCGNSKAKRRIIKSFGSCFVGEDVEPSEMDRPELNLEVLKAELPAPSEYGVEYVQVKDLTYKFDNDLRTKLDNSKRGDTNSICDLLEDATEEHDNFLDDAVLIGGTLKIYLLQGQAFFPTAKAITIGLSAGGVIKNLDKYSEAEQETIKKILVSLGVMDGPTEIPAQEREQEEQDGGSIQ